ncbi:MAG: carbon starvation CstA family protein, partial [Lentisphaerota bacterium]
MNVLWIIGIALPVFFLGYRFYSRYLQRTMIGDEEMTPPSIAMKDGVDYVPSKTPVVFSHHFASIAGAGPIVGPTVAMIYGYVPVWLWVLLGAVFIGAVQDYTSLFVSMRERGHSMAQVAHRTMGKPGFFLVIAFSIIMLLLLTSAFLGLTATALTSLVPLEQMHITAESTFLHVVTGPDGIARAKIGGIASSSLIVITLMAPLLGWLVFKRNASLGLMIPLALATCAVSILGGLAYPLTLKPTTWMVALTGYVILASGVPVWALLQPRDFINSFLLYFGMLLLLLGALVAGFQGDLFRMPALNLAGGDQALGMVWPFLFVTVACGAISGFHAMVTGGTTSKQLKSERDARIVGYGGMLMEAVLSLLVVIAVGAGLTMDQFKDLVFPTLQGAGSNPVLAFAMGVGSLVYRSLGIHMEYGTVFGMLMVEGFIVTTLDTAARLNRYLLEELWAMLFGHPPRLLRSHLFNSTVVAGLMLVLCYTNTFKYIWPIFGSANQLMAALTMVVVAVWLALRKKPTWFAVWPAVFMMATTLVSLWQL